ncbi:hypothetical protein JNUCC1_00287 [Lentibacillus sp. JNUCC-1]|uniref:hypothetical protein n=1 Tax=Lentibacillus sp. JNUCC-1 TaxID=2654513 RepID=UPI0012E7ED22|nr:hypothetical protein [Lentibacillus sp. JNUCC-1]MUV36485.1 hypothetical protein [Lentibacillus sp. JNUCC-1]
MSMDEDEVLKQARTSGLTYNQAKAYIARTTGGKGTHIYSNTDTEAVRQKNAASMSRKQR